MNDKTTKQEILAAAIVTVKEFESAVKAVPIKQDTLKDASLALMIAIDKMAECDGISRAWNISYARDKSGVAMEDPAAAINAFYESISTYLDGSYRDVISMDDAAKNIAAAIIEAADKTAAIVKNTKPPTPETAITGVKQYRKKPVAVEALLWTGENIDDVKEFMGNAFERVSLTGNIVITTHEGEMVASPGDKIIKEPFPTGDRDFYPCKPDIFAKTYEEINE